MRVFNYWLIFFFLDSVKPGFFYLEILCRVCPLLGEQPQGIKAEADVG